MTDRQVQIEFAKNKANTGEAIAVIYYNYGGSPGPEPTTWEQLQEMMMNAADSGDWNETMHNLVMSLMLSLVALGNVNVSSIQLAILHSSWGKPGGRVDQIYDGQSEGASPD